MDPWDGWACHGPSSQASPYLSQVKPVVSQFFHEKQLPYNEDSYLARLGLFLSRYEEFMVHAPPITELVGLQ
jgi:fatty acid desaturase 6